MREIKFRGISTRTGEFVYGYLVKCNGKDGDYFAIKEDIYNVNNGRPDLIPEPVLEETIGQYTGLKGKNWKEVYEGDIVSSFYGEPFLVEHKIIKFTETIGHGATAEKFISGFTNNYDDLLVIGNIHENPDY